METKYNISLHLAGQANLNPYVFLDKLNILNAKLPRAGAHIDHLLQNDTGRFQKWIDVFRLHLEPPIRSLVEAKLL
ncbi:hypothetical protein D3C87_1984520 [compost metagenome]